jgi:hypothetical protein
MEIILRDYAEKDFPQVLSVFRDSAESLRVSQGGKHPDKAVDALLLGTDKQVYEHFAGSAKLVVAQVKETGEIAGTGGIARASLERFLGSAFSTSHYVKRSFQRGKAGVSVGSLLRKATISQALEMRCRKIYGFSTPEAIGFHRKFGAVFYPKNDRTYAGDLVPIHYYEIEVRRSILNALPIEPGICQFRSMRKDLRILWGLIFGFKKKPLLYPIYSLFSWAEIGILLLITKPKEEKKRSSR